MLGERQRSRDSGGALVITTKLRPPQKEEKRDNVAYMPEKSHESDENDQISDARILRYQMQSVAKALLRKHRVGICLRHQIEKYGSVDLYKHRQSGKVHYGGLMTCGNVWVCPVCAAKVSERRRKELKTAFDAHLAAGGHCTMLTLTFAHTARDKLYDLLNALGGATQAFRRGKRFDAFRAEIGLIGSIRAFEITYGVNGWHPHIHLLLMHDTAIDPWDWMDIKEQLYDMWRTACARHGLSCSREHGLMMTDAREASTYIGKWGDEMDKPWGTDSEMTKANIKKGREGSMTPFDFLRSVIEDGDLGVYGKQFCEYAAAVKGKHQLGWSPGLKARYLIEEKTDEQIAAEKLEPSDWLGDLAWKEWRYVLANELRYQLQKTIEDYGYEEALIRLGIRPVTKNGQNKKYPLGADTQKID